MRKIALFCSGGMSTSLLVKKMEEAAKKKQYDCVIEAYALSTVYLHGPEADLIFLGPQIRFSVPDVKKQCPNVPVELIDMAAYGTMDGEKIIAQAMKILGN
jgi:PTS system cellobiose-specific IIB component